jgi:hypothetical protein
MVNRHGRSRVGSAAPSVLGLVCVSGRRTVRSPAPWFGTLDATGARTLFIDGAGVRDLRGRLILQRSFAGARGPGLDPGKAAIRNLARSGGLGHTWAAHDDDLYVAVEEAHAAPAFWGRCSVIRCATTPPDRHTWTGHSAPDVPRLRAQAPTDDLPISSPGLRVVDVCCHGICRR